MKKSLLLDRMIELSLEHPTAEFSHNCEILTGCTSVWQALRRLSKSLDEYGDIDVVSDLNDFFPVDVRFIEKRIEVYSTETVRWK